MSERKYTPGYTAEFRARGVRLYQEQRSDYASDNAAFPAVSEKLGGSRDALRVWCRQWERDAGERAGLSNEEQSRLKALEREVRERRQANEILKKASAYFAPPLGDCGAVHLRAMGRSSSACCSDDFPH